MKLTEKYIDFLRSGGYIAIRGLHLILYWQNQEILRIQLAEYERDNYIAELDKLASPEAEIELKYERA